MGRVRVHSDAGNFALIAPADLRARIDRDQMELRAPREHWLTVEREKYDLPRRARLIDEMAA